MLFVSVWFPHNNVFLAEWSNQQISARRYMAAMPGRMNHLCLHATFIFVDDHRFLAGAELFPCTDGFSSALPSSPWSPDWRLCASPPAALGLLIMFIHSNVQWKPREKLVSLHKYRKFTETSVRRLEGRTAGRTQWRREREREKGPEKMQRQAAQLKKTGWWRKCV